MLAALVRFLARCGGVLVRPRATVASLGPDEGRRDGLWLGLLFFVGGHLLDLLEGLATLVAVRNWGGVAVVISKLGVLVAPILASIVAETILGSERAKRAGLCIVPLVVISVAAHAALRLGVTLPGPGWLPTIVGMSATIGLAFTLRFAEDAETVPGAGSVSRLGAALGGLVVVVGLGVGGADLRRGIASWSELGPLPPGDRVEDFRVRMLDGEVLTAEGLEGKVSVVTFWATWCGVCVSELPDFDALARQYADRPVQFVAVNREGGGLSLEESVALVRQFAGAHGLSLPMAVDDGSMARAFRVGPIPHTVVFDTGGVMRHVHQGRVTSATIEREIEALLRRSP
jgi:thiol-disulfide isomerase/thioredoxin